MIQTKDSAEGGNLKVRSYNHIKRKILSLEFKPGDPLSEKQLMEEIGASRTPIREALNKLEEEHLVKIHPMRGIFVTEVSVKDVVDVYSLRTVLEPFAVRLAMSRLTPTALEPYSKFWGEASSLHDNEEHLLMDSSFHRCISDASSNKYLIQTLSLLYNQAARIRMLSLSRFMSRREETKAEHLEIIDAIMAGDSLRAEKAMATHMTHATETALRVFSTQ